MERLLDASVVAAVVVMLGLMASAPRAAREAATWAVTVVAAPPAVCAGADAPHRGACLAAARAAVTKP